MDTYFWEWSGHTTSPQKVGDGKSPYFREILIKRDSEGKLTVGFIWYVFLPYIHKFIQLQKMCVYLYILQDMKTLDKIRIDISVVYHVHQSCFQHFPHAVKLWFVSFPSTWQSLLPCTWYYCWWKKSCTTWDVKNPVNTGINYQAQLVSSISEPSTVVFHHLWVSLDCFLHHNW